MYYMKFMRIIWIFPSKAGSKFGKKYKFGKLHIKIICKQYETIGVLMVIEKFRCTCQSQVARVPLIWVVLHLYTNNVLRQIIMDLVEYQSFISTRCSGLCTFGPLMNYQASFHVAIRTLKVTVVEVCYSSEMEIWPKCSIQPKQMTSMDLYEV